MLNVESPPDGSDKDRDGRDILPCLKQNHGNSYSDVFLFWLKESCNALDKSVSSPLSKKRILSGSLANSKQRKRNKKQKQNKVKMYRRVPDTMKVGRTETTPLCTDAAAHGASQSLQPDLERSSKEVLMIGKFRLMPCWSTPNVLADHVLLLNEQNVVPKPAKIKLVKLQRLASMYLEDRQTFELKQNLEATELVNATSGLCSKTANKENVGGSGVGLQNVFSADETPPNENDELGNTIGVTVAALIPWFPVMPKDVCFGWSSHTGTIMWRNAIKQFSDNWLIYPEWNIAIVDGVKEKLAKEDIAIFLVFLDGQGNPSESIHEGLWYRATEKDIVEKTKEQFLADRRA